MSTETTIRDSIEQAAATVAPVWPLHSFVTANPLAGFEDRPFHEAVRRAEGRFGGAGYPSAETFRRAYEAGRIDPDVLAAELDERVDDDGWDGDDDPETLLAHMAADGRSPEGDETADGRSPEGDETADGRSPEGDETADGRVDALLTKWLSAFLDQGQAEWPMPNREAGFYAAFRAAARHDGAIPNCEAIAALPEDPVRAIEQGLSGRPEDRWVSILENHLTALPGWTGLIKRRAAEGSAWQSAYPITLVEYLAVRLTLVDLFDTAVGSSRATAETHGGSADRPGGADAAAATDAADTADAADAADGPPLEEDWLTAWEVTYRERLADAVADGSASLSERGGARPDAQFVFCIDTRSEIIRRHIEAAGEYETHGYAGFFGVPMRYEGHDADAAVDACPPILDARHRITERPRANAGGPEGRACVDERKGRVDGGHAHGSRGRRGRYDRWSDALDAGTTLLKSLKSNAATAFSFVEAAGSGYGLALAARTLSPARVFDLVEAIEGRLPDAHEVRVPAVDRDPNDEGGLPSGLTLAEKVEYAETAFGLMGWETFARVVVFAGHASRTANNPFDSSLDCGACAGNPGGPSARVLASICNDEAVKNELRERGFDVPADTVFLAGEHNTTTDEVTLYAEDVPASHEDDVERLRADLATARADAAAERVASMRPEGDTGFEAAAGSDRTAVRETERRAADWAEPRPEWGLAGNAGFVVGPRELTADLDLAGRSFLHSYDWRTDGTGEALEAILTGPMVVAQWINAQYYFATVDNAAYGAGSKVTHNPVGNVGVYQGNGGDLLTGLPLQSVMADDDEPYHQPLRLSTVVHAPRDRVTDVLSTHPDVAELLDNGWLSLTVVDPTRNDGVFHYDGDLCWNATRDAGGPTASPEPTQASPAADD